MSVHLVRTVWNRSIPKASAGHHSSRGGSSAPQYRQNRIGARGVSRPVSYENSRSHSVHAVFAIGVFGSRCRTAGYTAPTPGSVVKIRMLSMKVAVTSSPSGIAGRSRVTSQQKPVESHRYHSRVDPVSTTPLQATGLHHHIIDEHRIHSFPQHSPVRLAVSCHQRQR